MVVQTAARGSAGFQVEISDSLVDSVTGGSLFSIASGNLVVENLTVTNVEAAAIVGSSGGSAVVLKDVKVTESTVQVSQADARKSVCLICWRQASTMKEILD